MSVVADVVDLVSDWLDEGGGEAGVAAAVCVYCGDCGMSLCDVCCDSGWWSDYCWWYVADVSDCEVVGGDWV